jgi:hypothetical protein
MEFIILDLDDEISSEEIFEVISENHKTSTLIDKEVKKLKELSSKSTKRVEDDNKTPEKEMIYDEADEVNSELDDKVDYYNYLISSIDDCEDLQDQIESSLPNPNTGDYKTIVLRLKLKLLKRIKETADFISECREEFDDEDLEEYKEEIRLCSKKLEILKSESNEEVNENKTSTKNNFFFPVSSMGNIRVIDEIEKISKSSPEFCSEFLELFQSIQDGSFKRVKRFLNNNKLVGISEVRGFKPRVVFDRIGKNDYAIITAFLKKCDNDRGYKDSLELKIQKYMSQRDNIVKRLNNPEFRALNEQYTNELFGKLGYNKEDSKSIEKRLG